MRTISNTTQFSLHYLIFADRMLRSDLPENLASFCTDSTTNEPITISFRCNDDEWFNKILVLSYKDDGVLKPIEKYTTKGFYGKTGGIELISEYLLSNFITDIYDEEYTSSTWIDENGKEIITDEVGRLIVDWVSIDHIPPFPAKKGDQFIVNGVTYKYDGFDWLDDSLNYISRDPSGKIIANGRTTDFYPHRIHDSEDEFIFNNLKYKRVYVNNLTLAPDFRNLIPKREYPSFDFDDFGTIYGNSRFQYNINYENLKKYWLDDYSVPKYIFELLTSDQKTQAAKFLSSIIESDWKSVLKKIFNQEFSVEDVKFPQKSFKDTWGSEMYSSLGGDGEENIYLSDGVSIRPDGSLTED